MRRSLRSTRNAVSCSRNSRRSALPSCCSARVFLPEGFAHRTAGQPAPRARAPANKAARRGGRSGVFRPRCAGGAVRHRARYRSRTREHRRRHRAPFTSARCRHQRRSRRDFQRSRRVALRRQRPGPHRASSARPAARPHHAPTIRQIPCVVCSCSSFFSVLSQVACSPCEGPDEFDDREPALRRRQIRRGRNSDYAALVERGGNGARRSLLQPWKRRVPRGLPGAGDARLRACSRPRS